MTVPPVAPPQPPAQQPASSGCLKIAAAGCAVLLVISVVGTVLLAVFVVGLLKSTGPYGDARDRVLHDPRVIERLGSPVDTGWWIRGSVDIKNRRGDADFQFPVHGPKGRATVHAIAVREDGEHWRFSRLTVTPEAGNGPPIELAE